LIPTIEISCAQGHKLQEQIV